MLHRASCRRAVAILAAGLKHGYSPGMKGARNLDKLADRYLDLWERQTDALASDPSGLWALDAWMTAFSAERLRADLEERSGESVEKPSGTRP